MSMLEQLFTRKPVHVLLAETEGDHGLRKVLGPVQLTALGVGCIIGAGIFVLTGLAANQFAGPALVLSFVVAGVGCTLAALCYAEFAAMVPVAGSAYTYAYAHAFPVPFFLWDARQFFGCILYTVFIFVLDFLCYTTRCYNVRDSAAYSSYFSRSFYCCSWRHSRQHSWFLAAAGTHLDPLSDTSQYSPSTPVGLGGPQP